MKPWEYRPLRDGALQLSSMAEVLVEKIEVPVATTIASVGITVEGKRGEPTYSLRIVPYNKVVPQGRQIDIRRPQAAHTVHTQDPGMWVDLNLLGDQTDTVGAHTNEAGEETRLVVKLRDPILEWLSLPSALQRYPSSLRIHIRARANLLSGAYIRPLLVVNGQEFRLGTTYLGPEWQEVGGKDGIGVSYNPYSPSRWSVGDWYRLLGDDNATSYGLGFAASPKVEIAEFWVEAVHWRNDTIGSRVYYWRPEIGLNEVPYDAQLTPGTYAVIIEPVVVDGLNHITLVQTEDAAVRTTEIWRRDTNGLPSERLRSIGHAGGIVLMGNPACHGVPYVASRFADEGDAVYSATSPVNALAVYGKQFGTAPSFRLVSGSNTRTGSLRRSGRDPAIYTAAFSSVPAGGGSIDFTGLAPAVLRGEFHWQQRFEAAVPTTTVQSTNWTGASPAHTAVDDPVGDDDEDYSALMSVVDGADLLMRVGSSVFSATLPTPLAVAVVARAGSASKGRIRGLLQTGSTKYAHPAQIEAKTGYDLYQWIWPVRPEDGNDWTLADVRAFRQGGTRAFGLRKVGNEAVMVTQCYLRVYYSADDLFLAVLGADEYVDNINAPYDDYVVQVGAVGTISGLSANVDRALGRVTLSWTTSGTVEGAAIFRGGVEIGRTTSTSFVDYEPPIGAANYAVRPYAGMLEGQDATTSVDLRPCRHAIIGSNEAAAGVPLVLWPNMTTWEVAPEARFGDPWAVSQIGPSARKIRIEASVHTEHMDRQTAQAQLRAMHKALCRLRIPGGYGAYVRLGDLELEWSASRKELKLRADAWEVDGPVSVRR